MPPEDSAQQAFPDFVVDLSNCDKEPIHIPSAIQPHGVLICVGSDFKIIQCSENTISVLGAPATELLNQSFLDLMESEQQEMLKDYLDLENLKTLIPLAVQLKWRNAEAVSVSCFAHKYPTYIVLELEPTDLLDTSPRVLLPGRLTGFIDALQRQTNIGGTLQSATESIKQLTGYDRVMVYKFDHDWHGEVVAESKEKDLESLLGLHYPASDIPVQARILYKRNLLRMISDVAYNSVNLFPLTNAATDSVLDMSDCVLRSVSPIHIEYLLNMGVKATLTISIMVHGELWGLIACHNHAPKYSPLWMRSACEMLGQLVALRVLGFLDSERYKAQAKGAELFDEILSALDKNDADLGKIFQSCSEKLLNFFDSTGVVAILGEDTLRTGFTPLGGEVPRIAEALDIKGEVMFHTNCLKEFLGEDSPSQFAGLLAIRVSTIRNEWIAFFRQEQRLLVNWAGDPRKSVTVESGGIRLHPRGSFAVWTEEVKDKSKDWSLAEVSAATIFREKILELRQETLDRERRHNEALRREREDLLAGLTHDLKNPILGTIKVLELIGKGQLAVSDVLEQLIETQKKLYTRVSSFLLLNKYSDPGNQFSYGTIDLKSLIATAVDICRAYAKAEGVSLETLLNEDCNVLGEQDAICRVVENLINNAIKFSPFGSTVCINLKLSGADALITVVDSGLGVPEEELPLIFKRFWQGQSSRNVGNGSGLGLYTCRQIVESHRGSIWCESKVGSGASFFVKLPCIVASRD